MSELRRLRQTNHKFETSLGYTEKRLQKTNQAKQTSESLDESSGAQQRSRLTGAGLLACYLAPSLIPTVTVFCIAYLYTQGNMDKILCI